MSFLKFSLFLIVITATCLITTNKDSLKFNSINIQQRAELSDSVYLELELEFDSNSTYWAEKIFSLSKDLDLMIFFNAHPKKPLSNLQISLSGNKKTVQAYLSRLMSYKKI